MSSRLLAVLSVGLIVCSLILGSCAKMGQPDGGWYINIETRINLAILFPSNYCF